MELFKRPHSQKIVTSTLLATLAAALGIFLVLLITDASRLSHVTTVTTVRGWLGLYELQKGPLPDGSYQASIAFLLPGLAAYTMSALVLAAIIIAVRLRRHPTKG